MPWRQIPEAWGIVANLPRAWWAQPINTEQLVVETAVAPVGVTPADASQSNSAEKPLVELLLVKHMISQIAGRNAEGLAGDISIGSPLAGQDYEEWHKRLNHRFCFRFIAFKFHLWTHEFLASCWVEIESNHFYSYMLIPGVAF